MKRILPVILGCILSVPAYADGFRVVGLNGSDTVFVWRDKNSHDEALNLINAGVHRTKPELLLPLLACVVASGTAAIVTDGGFITQDVMIVSGENAGCRGNIPTESLKAN